MDAGPMEREEELPAVDSKLEAHVESEDPRRLDGAVPVGLRRQQSETRRRDEGARLARLFAEDTRQERREGCRSEGEHDGGRDDCQVWCHQ